MDINSQQAREALDEIKDAAGQARQVLIDRLAGRCLIWWGSLIALAYLLTWFLVRHEDFDSISYVWWGLMGLGGVGGWLMERKHPMMGAIDARVGWFWLYLCGFCAVWLYVMHPWNGIQLNVFLMTAAMFAYVVLGIFAWPVMWSLGVWCTILILVGYHYSHHGERAWFWLWMAACIGGPLIGTGLSLLKRKPAEADHHGRH